MKIKTLSLLSIFSICLSAAAAAQASSYEQAVSEATAAIDAAKAVNYEWRDSRKMLKQANKLHKEGKSDEAMKLVTKARDQGKLALSQAQLQAKVNGPH